MNAHLEDLNDHAPMYHLGLLLVTQDVMGVQGVLERNPHALVEFNEFLQKQKRSLSRPELMMWAKKINLGGPDQLLNELVGAEAYEISDLGVLVLGSRFSYYSPRSPQQEKLLQLLLQYGWPDNKQTRQRALNTIYHHKNDPAALIMGKSFAGDFCAEEQKVLYSMFLHADSDRQTVLSQLVSYGVFRPNEGAVAGVFISKGDLSGAQKILSASGLSLQKVLFNVDVKCPNDPLCSYLNGLIRLNNRLDEKSTQRLLNDFDWLKKNGANFEGGPSLNEFGCQPLNEYSNPLYLVARLAGGVPQAKYFTPLAECLIAHGASAQKEGAQGALQLIEQGNPGDGLVLLSKHGWNVKNSSSDLLCTLSQSSRYNWAQHELVVEKLVQLGLSYEDSPIKSRIENHPIALACVQNRSKWATFLIKKGVNPRWSATNESYLGFTIVHLLAEASPTLENLRVIEAVLATDGGRAQINTKAEAPRKKGLTALMLASNQLNLPAMAALLKNGADPNLQDEYGQSALHHVGKRFSASIEGKSKQAVELLIEANINVHLKNKKGQTAAQMMTARAPLGSLMELLAHAPLDVAGSEPEAREAAKKLAQRGGDAVSKVEQLVLTALSLNAEATLGDERKEDSMPTVKPRRSRL